MVAISNVPPSALPPESRGDVLFPGPSVGLPAELTSSFLSLWTQYAGKEPARAHTEIRGNVVTCTLVDSVDDYDREMATRKAGTHSGDAKLSEAAYKREAVATICRLTHQRVISFLSSHDRDTDVATEVFTLEPSLRRGARPSRRVDRASNRGQTDSNRDRDAKGSGASLSEADVASQAERARSTAERVTAREMGQSTSADRREDAARRDEVAGLRDLQAGGRDRTAELRDQAAEAHIEAFQREDIQSPGGRATAAADRVRAAEDRAHAAEDRAQASTDRERARSELEEAQLDDLTGFYRPSLGRAMLQREIDRSRRTRGSLVFAYCDVDGLKRVNDDHGHAAGDALLRAVAGALRSRLRSYDPVVRIGGDEFVCALADTGVNQAGRIFGEVRKSIAAASDGESMTFGLAALKHDDSLVTLLERSDQALREVRTGSGRSRRGAASIESGA